MPEQCCAVILAAGEGKRMKSSRPKVLSPVLFKPMLQWVIDSAEEAGVSSICVITGYMHEKVEQYLSSLDNTGVKISHAFQAERKGTGHAVMMAEEFLRAHHGKSVLILNGDAPFVNAKVIEEARRAHTENSNAVTVISAVLDDPTGYGRIVRDPQTHLLRAIVEQKDADRETLSICEINSGAYWFQVDDLLSILNKIQNNNAQGEYYLPDAVKLLIESGKRVAAHTTSEANAVLGANDCLQLNALNSIAREEILSRHMKNGIEIPCRDGVMIGPDVKIGSDTCILPGTILRGKTVIGCGCTVGPNSFVSDCTVGDGVCLRYVQCENSVIEPNQAVAPFSVINH
ncbi:cytidylyltransferase [Caproiciproducens galactitolivorans]|uniref:Bifunctional protein GlmU n=1 Tax=Caproiciproducens galactitolivorans TaxID=642589 RepID=A0A4Z0YCQ6_9FIRM|nr:sugar phosphate nucleotidyltransferase [Caproiciproducens galactitolivorans]QEY35342.1 cytidylyltransferase [Caproiciproducens galactitolivorans]TGJ77041.1 bifunctional protein GlmU [Caproiciproducens galactitolivorans]